MGKERHFSLSLWLGSSFGNESSSGVAWQEESLKRKTKRKGNERKVAAFLIK